MIKNFTPRLYQQTIFATASAYNTLVVLPTGLGKTNIALMLASHRLTQYPESKILLVGPTRPLIDQYRRVFETNLAIDPKLLATFTGQVAPSKRQELWKSSSIIFSTPQGLENDIISSKIDLSSVSLLIVDEAHRAVGDYSYVYLAKRYAQAATSPRILALTASPGSDLEKIAEVCKNLFVEEIEVRTELDPDVKPYIQPLKTTWIPTTLPPQLKEIQFCLATCFNAKVREIKQYLPSIQIPTSSRRELLALQGELHGQIGNGDRSPEMLRSVSLAAQAMKVQHAIELLETQGIPPLVQYMDRIFQDSVVSSVKAVQNLVQDPLFREGWMKAKSLLEQKIDHPKMDELLTLVKSVCGEGKKVIVFNQYRDSAVQCVEKLNSLSGIHAELFVGQASKNGTGMSQKEQIKLLERFGNGEFNILVSSSVGEEGLDIPLVDAVIFYEAIPSVIRTIQRRGRTARHGKGEVYILFTKDTRDEAYRWASVHKEKQMYRTLSTLKSKLGSVLKKEIPQPQPTLQEFGKKRPIIYTDYREKANAIVKELLEMNMDLRLEKIDVGDYILSHRVGVEFKTAEDFVDSIIDGRLLTQLRDLRANFLRPLVVIQGERDLYGVRNIHPNAIQGMLSTITVSYGIPLLFTKNAKETAQLFSMIAKREQDDSESDFSLHGEKKPLSQKELQEYIVSALPGIGTLLARPLLEQFGTIKNIANATEEELQHIEKIGPTKSKRISEIMNAQYRAEKGVEVGERKV